MPKRVIIVFSCVAAVLSVITFLFFNTPLKKPSYTTHRNNLSSAEKDRVQAGTLDYEPYILPIEEKSSIFIKGIEADNNSVENSAELSEGAGKSIIERQIPYNEDKETSPDTDGTVSEKTENSQPTEKTADKRDSEPMKVLKELYDCLSSEDKYDVGMDLLHKDFKIKLRMFKQFGAEEVIKDDLDRENVSVYRNILAMAKLDTVVKEELSQNTSAIYYYQVFETQEGSQTRIPLVAQLVKENDSWKVISLVDGNIMEKPFAE